MNWGDSSKEMEIELVVAMLVSDNTEKVRVSATIMDEDCNCKN